MNLHMIPPAYHRSLLTPYEQIAYKELVNRLLRYAPVIQISTPGIESNSLSRIINAVSLDHPELFFVDFWHYTIIPATPFSPMSIRFSMMIEESTAKSVLARMETCSEKLKKVNLHSSQPEKIYTEIIYDILRTVSYKDTKSAFWDHTAAGPVLHHTAVCEGIAKLFLFYCQRLDQPCAVIAGNLNGQPHAWNLIEIRGERKYVDITSALNSSFVPALFPKSLYKSRDCLIKYGYSW